MKKILCHMVFIFAASCFSCKKHNIPPETSQQLHETDRDFLVKAGYDNMACIDACQLARAQSRSGNVRALGCSLINSHQTAYRELRALGIDMSLNIPQIPDSAHLEMRKYLMNLSGRSFDAVFLQLQIEDQKRAVALLESEIANGKDDRVRAFANKYLPVARLRLAQADSLRQLSR